jgi:hypothetical protein
MCYAMRWRLLCGSPPRSGAPSASTSCAALPTPPSMVPPTTRPPRQRETCSASVGAAAAATDCAAPDRACGRHRATRALVSDVDRSSCSCLRRRASVGGAHADCRGPAALPRRRAHLLAITEGIIFFPRATLLYISNPSNLEVKKKRGGHENGSFVRGSPTRPWF